MNLRTQHFITELEQAERSLASPLRKQFYRNLREHLEQLATEIEKAPQPETPHV